jgi:hypothetical protein
LRPVRLAYQPTASSTFLSQQSSHQQSASSTFISEQISTSHRPPAKRTGCWFGEWEMNNNEYKFYLFFYVEISIPYMHLIKQINKT